MYEWRSVCFLYSGEHGKVCKKKQQKLPKSLGSFGEHVQILICAKGLKILAISYDSEWQTLSSKLCIFLITLWVINPIFQSSRQWHQSLSWPVLERGSPKLQGLNKIHSWTETQKGMQDHLLWPSIHRLLNLTVLSNHSNKNNNNKIEFLGHMPYLKIPSISDRWKIWTLSSLETPSCPIRVSSAISVTFFNPCLLFPAYCDICPYPRKIRYT